MAGVTILSDLLRPSLHLGEQGEITNIPSFSPPCVTRTKTAKKKYSRENLEARRFSPPGFNAAIFFSRFPFASRTTD